MRSVLKCIRLTWLVAALCLASAALSPGRPGASQVRSTEPIAASGATFTVPQAELNQPLTVIAYGDMRFTDSSNTTATNPIARQALVKRITEERPDALLLNGDVPWHGGNQDDYAVYKTETQAWRDAHLHVFPALGNHELAQCGVPQCLANWWSNFPELKDRRWYSVCLSTSIYIIALDSNDSLLPGSEQRHWLENQIDSLPSQIKFVLIAMHHPPVADIQSRFNVDHNPRPNEIAFAKYLKTASSASRARFVVIAGHIHNYERFLEDGIVYLVSGGGGAKPYEVDRTALDLYQDSGFPNYHYVKFVLEGQVLRGTMYRFSGSDPEMWQAKDTFQIHSK